MFHFFFSSVQDILCEILQSYSGQVWLPYSHLSIYYRLGIVLNELNIFHLIANVICFRISFIFGKTILYLYILIYAPLRMSVCCRTRLPWWRRGNCPWSFPGSGMKWVSGEEAALIHLVQKPLQDRALEMVAWCHHVRWQIGTHTLCT